MPRLYRTFLAVCALSMPAIGWAEDPTPAPPGGKAEASPTLEWKKAAPSPFARVESPTAVVDGKMYLFGGFTDDLGASNEVDVYDPANDSWTRKKDMPTRLTHLNPAIDGKTIWFAGGFQGKHPGPASDEVWKYDVAADAWTAGPPLPERRAGGGLAVVGTSLHYFGGFKADRDTNATEHWSLSLEGGKEWRREADLPDPRGHVCAVVLDGKLYALGGTHGHDVTQIDLASCHRYDPATKKWTEIASLPDGRSHFEGSTIIYKGRILVVGGRCNSSKPPRGVVGDLLEYDPQSDAWSVVGEMPEKVLAPSAAIIAGRLIVTGGGLNNPRPLTAVTWVAEPEKNTAQEEAIAAVKKMGGFVDTDPQRLGNPVIRVHLYGGKTAGVGLAPLAKLPETEWIGLHASDMTETDLEYLKGLTKLRRLGLANTRLSDAGLKRLEGMTTLEILYLMENPITDAGLDHLRKLTKLKELGLGQTKVTDAGLERLKTFPDLQILGLENLSITDAGLEHLKALTRLQKLDLSGCNQIRELKSLHGLPLTSLNLAYWGKLEDVAPLEGMPLTSLNLFGCAQLHDLAPLAKMPLTSLDIGATQVADLSSLRGMKLTSLNCTKTQISDLAPLAGMPLTSLNVLDCPKLHDLTPLKQMNLSELSLTPTNFTKDSLEVLRQCKSLKTIVIGPKYPDDRLAAQDFWKKFDGGEFKP